MNLELLKKELVNENSLERIIFLDHTESTNKYASQNVSGNNVLIVTSEQTEGAGRFNKQWFSTSGKSLTFSLIKKFNIGVDEIHVVNFYSSYILFDSLKSRFLNSSDFRIRLKWPNDILLNNKKIAGLLLESKHLTKPEKTFIIGIGLNVNDEQFPEHLNNKATSLYLETKIKLNPEELLIDIIKNFYKNIELISNKSILMKLWCENSLPEGTKVSFKRYDDDTELRAKFNCIENDGALSVIFENGVKEKFYSGQISLIL